MTTIVISQSDNYELLTILLLFFLHNVSTFPNILVPAKCETHERQLGSPERNHRNGKLPVLAPSKWEGLITNIASNVI